MANEPGPDEMHDLWRSQKLEQRRMSVDELRHQHLLCVAKMRHAFWIALALSLSSAALCLWFLYLLPFTLPRIGFVLTFAGELWFVYQFLRLRRAGDGQAVETGAAYRAHLVSQRDLALTMWWKFLLPFVPGPALVLLGFFVPEWGVARAVAGISAYLALPFVIAVPLARRKARRLEREITELDSELG